MKGNKIKLTRVTPEDIALLTAYFFYRLGKPFKVFDFKYAVKLCRRHNIINAYACTLGKYHFQISESTAAQNKRVALSCL